MSEVNWIQLWLLNELACYSSRMSRLIYHPDEQWSAYWDFPGRAILHSNEQERIEALLTCVKDGLIEIYPRSWFPNPRFDSRYPFPVAACKMHDARFVEDAEALLTFSGHEKWEADFLPDWNRYWMQVEGGNYDKSSHEEILSVVYASNEILEDLLQSFPSYWGLDKEIGLSELECRTDFQYSATSWKLLPSVKIIKWKGISSNKVYFRFLQALGTARLNPGETEGEAKAKLKRYMQVQSEEHEIAARILCRLSKKWKCVRAAEGDRRDAEPELIVES